MVDITRLFNKLTLKTEDTGKQFEMSICLAYGIDYVGKYKYPIIQDPRLEHLNDLFPGPLEHIAKNGSRYDFVSTSTMEYLSAKSTKAGDKICPQVIGQASKKKFRNFFGAPEDIKGYILDNINNLLNVYYQHTFDASIIFYNKKRDKLKFIKPIKDIDFDLLDLSFSRTRDTWNESNTLRLNATDTIGEFQVHNNRDCIKFRWNLEKILKLFPDHFTVSLII